MLRRLVARLIHRLTADPVLIALEAIQRRRTEILKRPFTTHGSREVEQLDAIEEAIYAWLDIDIDRDHGAA